MIKYSDYKSIIVKQKKYFKYKVSIKDKIRLHFIINYLYYYLYHLFAYFIENIFQKLIQETEEIQLAGTLDESAIGSLVKLVRESNVTLHWILLHTAMSTITLEDSKRSRALRQLVISESKHTTANCLRLLLSTAQIEQDVKQMYKDVCLNLFVTVYLL